MLFFHQTHCPYCRRMEHSTLEDAKIKNKLKQSFSLTKINTEIYDEKILFQKKFYTNKEFAHSLDVRFFPTVLFLDEENEVIYKARGYRDISTFKYILNFIKTKMYEEMSFFEYEEEQKKR